MRRSSCEDCRSSEEDLYWTHFSSIHFCQFLVGDFRCQLMIPEKFTEKIGPQLGDNILLRGPSGITWDVALANSEESIFFFGDGWEGFVNAHSLAENDILLFRYNGHSHFDVMVIDGTSLCERAESYFVRKCMPTSKGGNSSSIDIKVKDNSDGGVEPEPTGKVHGGTKRKLMCSGSWSGTEVEEDDDQVSTCVAEKRSILLEKLKLRCAGGSDQDQRKRRKTEDDASIYHICFASNRRPVTETEIAKTLDAASKESTPESFLVVMRATHVYKRFYMTLPAPWIATHLPHRKQDVILQVGNLTWKTRFLPGRDARGGLSRGWQDFALDNNLEEFDVCVFKLVECAGSDDDQQPATLGVSIYRVVDEVVPPTRSTPSPSLTVRLRGGGGRRGRGRGRRVYFSGFSA